MVWRKHKPPRTRRQSIVAALRNLDSAGKSGWAAESNRTRRRARKSLRAARARER